MELDIVAVLGMWISLVGMILWQSNRQGLDCRQAW